MRQGLDTLTGRPVRDLAAQSVDAIRRGERMACVDEIRRMAAVANGHGYGITYEGGIDAQDCARIMEACAREVEAAFEATATPLPVPDVEKLFCNNEEAEQ